MKLQKILGAVSAGILLSGLLVPIQAGAYFDRGYVKVTAASDSVTIKEGESMVVSLSLSPAQDTQLPGCGMAECPQTCGEGCLNEDGECMCAGLDETTYYTDVEVVSSNTSVAYGEYKNSAVTIHAAGVGTAVITLKASLRQYTSTSDKILVTVEKKPATTTTATSKKNTTQTKKTSQSSMKISAVTTAPKTTVKATDKKTVKTTENETLKTVSASQNATKQITQKEDASQQTVGSSGTSTTESSTNSTSSPETTALAQTTTDMEQTADQSETTASSGTTQGANSIKSEKGMVYFYEITGTAQGADALAAIAGTDEYAVFRKMDSTGTVLYSYEFSGAEIDTASDINYEMTISSDVPEWGAQAPEGSVFLQFAQDADLPGTSDTYIKIADLLPDAQSLYLYQVTSAGGLEQVTDTVNLSGGYAQMSLNQLENYVLSPEKISQTTQTKTTQNDSGKAWYWLLLIPAAAVIIVIFVVMRKRRR